MIKKLARLLGNIVGRIKRMARSEYFMMVGMMAFPTGIIIFLEFEKLKFASIVVITISLLSWLAGIFAMQSEEKQRQDDRIVTNNIVQTLITELKGVSNELKGIRGDINEHTDSDNRK